MANKNSKKKKDDPVIHVSPARYEQITRIAERRQISRKAALEAILAQRITKARG